MSHSQLYPRGLVLVGARGTGKSTVGRILAGRLGRPFLDADIELEARAGKTIRAIFAEEGEPAFRDWEERVLSVLTEQRAAVLATGGGAVLRESNRRRLREFGLVVWLSADPNTLARRLSADRQGLDDRPALTPAGTLGEIAAIVASRTPLYREVAHVAVDTAGRTADEVARVILEAWDRQDSSPGADGSS